jgi:hypothetical protein
MLVEQISGQGEESRLNILRHLTYNKQHVANEHRERSLKQVDVSRQNVE